MSYDGQEEAKKIDFPQPKDEAKPTYILVDLTIEEEEQLINLLKEYRDVFAWSYKDLKGVDPKVYQHTIPMRHDAKPSIQRPYSYNENFAKKIDEDIDCLKEPRFIFEIEHMPWVSPLVVVPKKNGKIQVSINIKKVNVATIRDHHPLPIIAHVIEHVACAKLIAS